MEYNDGNFLKVSDGCEIFYRYLKRSGNDKNLVFINGLFHDVDSWNSIAQLLDNHFNVLMYDLRGQGKSEVTTEAITLDLLVNDLFELISNLNINKVNIIGLDIGALVALFFANYSFEIVDRAIFIGPIFGDRWQMILNDWKNIAELLGDFALIKSVLPWLFSHDFIQNRQKELFEILDNMAEKIHLDKILKLFDSVANIPEVAGLFNNLAIPYLVVCGEEDSLCSITGLKSTLNVSEEKLNIIKGCGHWIFYEDPSSLSREILEFCK